MAHFAKLDDNNIVIDVNVVNNAVLDSADEEGSGIAFLTDWSGGYSNWKQTSFNGSFRYNYAGIGFTYDPVDDAFIAPMPECGHDELILNDKKQWQCANEEHNVTLS
jgi:hypothetical protein